MYNTVASTTVSVYEEIVRVKINLFALFPTGYKFQAAAYISSGVTSGDVELYDITSAAAVVSVNFTNTSVAIVESASQSPANALREYSIRIRRTGGVPSDKIFISSATLRAG
jgi:hypothetical protein